MIRLFTLLAVISLPLHSAELTAEQSDALETLDATIREAMREQPTPGLALAIAGPDGVRWSQGYGYADLATKRPVTPQTPFMLASVSKTFIAAATMSEVEAGRLDLQQPIDELLPFRIDNPRVDGETIRLWHLATHTSGIRDNYDFYDPSYAPGDPTIAMDHWIASYLLRGGDRYRKRKNFLRVEPGERYEYSNIGAALGAVIVEQSSGLDYRELTRERFFGPLGMENTDWEIRDFPADTLAVPYDYVDGRFVARPHYGLPTYADGQLRSSADDVARYLAMMLSDGVLDGKRVLSPESVETIEREWHVGSGEVTRGLYWSKRFEGNVLAHGGGDDGVSTFVFYHPKWQGGGVILLNTREGPAEELLILCLQSLTDALRAFRPAEQDVP